MKAIAVRHLDIPKDAGTLLMGASGTSTSDGLGRRYFLTIVGTCDSLIR